MKLKVKNTTPLPKKNVEEKMEKKKRAGNRYKKGILLAKQVVYGYLVHEICQLNAGGKRMIKHSPREKNIPPKAPFVLYSDSPPTKITNFFFSIMEN